MYFGSRFALFHDENALAPAHVKAVDFTNAKASAERLCACSLAETYKRKPPPSICSIWPPPLFLLWFPLVSKPPFQPLFASGWSFHMLGWDVLVGGTPPSLP